MKEVEIGEPVLAPPRPPHRESSCSQSEPNENHAARCSEAHAHDDLTTATTFMSGHLEAFTHWRDVCGQPSNPIEEQQRGEAALRSPLFVAFLLGGSIFLKNIPIILLSGALYSKTISIKSH